MRRALLILALAAPALAAAQTVNSGVVQNGTSQGAGEAIRDDRYINIDECTNTTGAYQLELFWNVKLETGKTANGGSYRIFGSNKEPPTAEPRYCPDADITGSNLYRWQIGPDVPAVANDTTDSTSIATNLFVTPAVGESPFTCTEGQTDQTIWLCVHYLNATDSTNSGWAVGSLTLALRRPPAPRAGSVVAAGGEGALDISWQAAPDPSGVEAPATGYRVIVTQGTTEVFRKDVTTLSLRVQGLANGTTYGVSVYGLSVAMNQSLAAETANGVPQPITDFWEYYQQRGGKEQGGCASGPAGSLALLGLAALLGTRRRRS